MSQQFITNHIKQAAGQPHQTHMLSYAHAMGVHARTHTQHGPFYFSQPVSFAHKYLSLSSLTLHHPSLILKHTDVKPETLSGGSFKTRPRAQEVNEHIVEGLTKANTQTHIHISTSRPQFVLGVYF